MFEVGVSLPDGSPRVQLMFNRKVYVSCNTWRWKVPWTTVVASRLLSLLSLMVFSIHLYTVACVLLKNSV